MKDLLSVLLSCSLSKHFPLALPAQPSTEITLPSGSWGVGWESCAGFFACWCVPLGPLLPCLHLAGLGPLLLLVEVSTINSHLILL